ncbi:MAG: glycosyltransferase family 1 protein, partial [bacterium]|nr:glycosyltransferase family 1 protein [bacterium]
MYCGSCIRDNALAAELIRQGHDVVLVPLYTPTRTDEENVSGGKVFFGGVSVFLEQKLALFRKTPRWLDRLWDSSWILKRVSKSSVKVDPESLGELTVAVLEGTHGPLRKEVDKLVDWLRHEGRPDVISLPFVLLISLARPLRQALDRPVVCGLQGEGMFLDG